MKYTSSCLREIGAGSWAGIIRYKDESGKWRQHERKLSATGKREAQRELDAWRAEMEEEAAWEIPGVKRPGDVGEFVAQYIDTLEQSQAVERSTLTAYRAMQKHIAHGLQNVPFEKLDADTAQAWVNDMAQDGYAPSTVRKAFNGVKAAYKDAVTRRTIPYNPLDGVKSPKLRKSEPNALGKAERARLLAYLEIAGDTPENLAVFLALNTGMREGELCGLRWRDVDLKGAVLHVRTVIGRDGGTTYVKEPKTGGSRRSIPLQPDVVAHLRDRRTKMADDCMDAGVSMTLDHYVLGRIDGTYMEPHALWKEWKAIAKSLGLVGTEGRTPTFHDLRHTFATAAIASGADVKSVASVMGHSNAAMTLNIYASADEEAKRRMMQRAAAEIADAPKPAAILKLKPRNGTEG